MDNKSQTKSSYLPLLIDINVITIKDKKEINIYSVPEISKYLCKHFRYYE